MNQIATLLLSIAMCFNAGLACMKPTDPPKVRELQFEMPSNWEMGYQVNTWFGPGGDWGPTNMTIYTRIRGSNAKAEVEERMKSLSQHDKDRGAKRTMKKMELGGREVYITHYYNPDMGSMGSENSGTVYLDLDGQVVEIIIRDNPDNHLKDLDQIVKSFHWKEVEKKEDG